MVDISHSRTLTRSEGMRIGRAEICGENLP